MKFARYALLLTLLLTPLVAQADIISFNALDPGANAAARSAWLAAIGIFSPENLVDFESGFVNGQDVDDIGGLFPEGLVIRDNSAANEAVVRSGAGVIAGSNPVGTFAVTHNELAFLILDFTLNPVDYFGFLDIDHTGTTGTVYFTDGGSAAIGFETTGASGNSAEFFGVFRNDRAKILRVELDASGDGRWGVDNIEYGQAEAVPDPSVLILLGVSLTSLPLLRLRRRQ